MTYTTDNPIKFFLNDKNIASALKYDDIQINAIPSLDLVSSLYKTLSGTDDSLREYISNVELSVGGISSITDDKVKELSNTLSTYSNSLCASISVQVGNDIDNAKKEISSTLSSYTDSEILKLSTSLSDTVNGNYLHNTSDTAGSLTVTTDFLTKNGATLSGKTYIRGNFIQGKNTSIGSTIDGIVLGISATTNYDHAFTWNGRQYEEYYSKAVGSFNINPENKWNGFYIADKSLSDIIHDDVQITSDNLTAQISAASALVSAAVDADRIADKTELSNTLSAYSNLLCTNLSTQIDANRIVDKKELSNTLSSYSDSLWSNLSNSISTGGFVNYDKSTIEYVSNQYEHAIKITLNDNYDHSKILSVDTTDFIKDRILEKAEVTKDDDDNLVLRLTWKTSSTTSTWTDIKIADLAKIYKAGFGIEITEDLSISVTDDVAKQADFTALSAKVDILSTANVHDISVHVDSLQTYADALSSTNGTIDQLSDAIKYNSLSIVEISNTLPTINDKIDTVSAMAKTSKSFDDMLCSMVGITAIGVIPDLSNKLEETRYAIRMNANYVGKLVFNKYSVNYESPVGTPVALSTLIKTELPGIVLEGERLRNGSIIEVELAEQDPSIIPETDKYRYTYNYNNPIYAADAYYDTIDGIRLGHKDFLYVQSIDSTSEYVRLIDFNKNNVRKLAGASFYEPYKVSVDNAIKSLWLSGNNENTEYPIGIQRYETIPTTVVMTGHAISGTNSFYGSINNYGTANLSVVSADSLSIQFGKLIDFDTKKSLSSIVFSELCTVSSDLTNVISAVSSDTMTKLSTNLSNTVLISTLAYGDTATVEEICSYFNRKQWNNGDIIIIKQHLSSSDDELYSYSSYAYDCNEEPYWKAMDGNYSAKNVIFSYDLSLNGVYSAIGNIERSEKVVKTKGKSVEWLFDKMFDKTLEPTLSDEPSYSITLTDAGIKEVGTVITNPTYKVTYTPGKYKYAWNDEGSQLITDGTTLNSLSVKSTDDYDQELTATGTYSIDTTLTVDTATDFKLTAYGFKYNGEPEDSTIPVNNKGIVNTDVQRKDGTLDDASTNSITGAYRCFYGQVPVGSEFETDENNRIIGNKVDSDKIRSLGDTSKKYWKLDTSVSIDTTAGMKQFAFACVKGKYSQIKVNQESPAITNIPLDKVSIIVKDAGENDVEYDLFYTANSMGAANSNVFTISYIG